MPVCSTHVEKALEPVNAVHHDRWQVNVVLARKRPRVACQDLDGKVNCVARSGEEDNEKGEDTKKRRMRDTNAER